MFRSDKSRLIREYDHEQVWIEPWGANALRVRASYAPITDEEWALLPAGPLHAEIEITPDVATITNGKIKAEITKRGQITFFNQKGEILLRESEHTYQLKYGGRELIAHPGGSDFNLTLRFESNPSEKLYGMGQYQQNFFDLKGCQLELTHRNSQVSVPFVMSNLGYGFLWHNPAVGRVNFI